MPADGVADGTLREALEAVGLPQLTGRLDEEAHWAQQLSPGEQQRIAFARALMQKPEWLFSTRRPRRWTRRPESRLYQLVRERLRRPRYSASAIGRHSAPSTRAG
jgi:putative ATP-binding cassette transporter